MSLTPSAHADTFARDNLPPKELWPKLEFPLPELRYPERLNAAAALLDETIERLGADRIAIRMLSPGSDDGPARDGETWTYGELRRRVDRLARLLVEDHGLLPGNRVLLRIPNNPWVIACWLAVVKAGGVVVTTMVAWRGAELQKVADRVRPRIVIVDHRFREELKGLAEPGTRVLVLGGADDEVIGASAAKRDGFEAVGTAADDVALLGPTSGTTGQPKITMHFHRDVLALADTFARHVLRFEPDDVVAGSPPIAFTFGLGGLMVFPLRFGASVVLMERSSPAALADAVERFGVTVLFTAPTGYRAMLSEGRAESLRRLRIGVSAGEHLPASTWRAVEQASGLRLVDGIGATEMLHVFISASGEEIRPGSTGRAVPGFRAAILDEEGRRLPPGTPGRLAVVGPVGCRYLDDERQSSYVQHGWNITGDTYHMDEDGYFHYHARSDDMIVASGYNVAGPEVEAAIDAHPAVAESCVVGRPDPEKGAIVNAFVVLHDGTSADDATRESILGHLRTVLASYKLPRRIDFVASLPRNASGKLMRFLLRERAEAEAAAQYRQIEQRHG